MNLAQLKKSGGLVVGGLVPKNIEWTHLDKDGKKVTDKFTIHVRRHSFGEMETVYIPGESETSRNAKYLSASVLLGKNGAEELSYADAASLEPALGFLFLTAVNEVNTPKAKS